MEEVNFDPQQEPGLQEMVQPMSTADLMEGRCMGVPHPTRQMPRSETTDVERQNINVRVELGEDIDNYLRQLETVYDTTLCL